MKGPNDAENTVTTRQPSFINCRGNRFLILNQLFLRESKYKETGKKQLKNLQRISELNKHNNLVFSKML
jgi:hypothetical protein